MSSAEYYWTRNTISGLGKLWFPLAPQETTSTGGGESLLGSVVEELGGGLTGHYPGPYHMTTPRLVLSAVAQALPAGTAPVLVTQLTVPQQSLRIEKKGALKLGVGPFPSLPATFNLDIDYSRMQEISVSFGDDTEVRYIPTDYLARLYRTCNGDYRQLWPGMAIRLDDNYIVDQIVIAKEYSVVFKSAGAFGAAFDAKLGAIAAINAANAGISFAKTSASEVKVSVKSTAGYLVALKVIDWDDLD